MVLAEARAGDAAEGERPAGEVHQRVVEADAAGGHGVGHLVAHAPVRKRKAGWSLRCMRVCVCVHIGVRPWVLERLAASLCNLI